MAEFLRRVVLSVVALAAFFVLACASLLPSLALTAATGIGLIPPAVFLAIIVVGPMWSLARIWFRVSAGETARLAAAASPLLKPDDREQVRLPVSLLQPSGVHDAALLAADLVATTVGGAHALYARDPTVPALLIATDRRVLIVRGGRDPVALDADLSGLSASVTSAGLLRIETPGVAFEMRVDRGHDAEADRLLALANPARAFAARPARVVTIEGERRARLLGYLAIGAPSLAIAACWALVGVVGALGVRLPASDAAAVGMLFLGPAVVVSLIASAVSLDRRWRSGALFGVAVATALDFAVVVAAGPTTGTGTVLTFATPFLAALAWLAGRWLARRWMRRRP